MKEVIFSGVAGSLDARLKIGDVVIGRDIVQHDVDATAFGMYHLFYFLSSQ